VGVIVVTLRLYVNYYTVIQKLKNPLNELSQGHVIVAKICREIGILEESCSKLEDRITVSVLRGYKLPVYTHCPRTSPKTIERRNARDTIAGGIVEVNRPKVDVLRVNIERSSTESQGDLGGSVTRECESTLTVRMGSRNFSVESLSVISGNKE
jgi:hypothetical protein